MVCSLPSRGYAVLALSSSNGHVFLRSGRFYYAPNTYKELVIAERRRNGELITEDMGPKEAFTLK